MKNCSIDAIIIAKAIQKNELSILRGKEFKMSDKIKKIESMKTNKAKPKYTLNQLGGTVDKLAKRVDQLGETVDQLGETVDKLAKRVDQLGETVDKLAKAVYDGFKQVNMRLDRIEFRLDYIVKANNLKDLPENNR